MLAQVTYKVAVTRDAKAALLEKSQGAERDLGAGIGAGIQ